MGRRPCTGWRGERLETTALTAEDDHWRRRSPVCGKKDGCHGERRHRIGRSACTSPGSSNLASALTAGDCDISSVSVHRSAGMPNQLGRECQSRRTVARLDKQHCCAYLSEAPKSTRSYTAYNRASPGHRPSTNADTQAEALANKPPLPGVPLQIRNAPTTLMKKLGYGKDYAYNPNFAHPVHNEYLPEGILSHSTHAPDPNDHLLRTHEVEMRGKEWDDRRLVEWEKEVNRGEKWRGRKGAAPRSGKNSHAGGGTEGEPRTLAKGADG